MGTSLTGLTPATTYDALIKVGDNGPIDATLKVLSDGLGNNLPMEASSTTINFTNGLQQSGVAVPTASQVNAKQDTLVSGTNIKTINGTSVLGAGNIVTPSTSPSGVSGAIQFSNGSAFASDASNFFWDNTNKRLGVGTNAPNTNFEVYSGAGGYISHNASSGYNGFSGFRCNVLGGVRGYMELNPNTGEFKVGADGSGYFLTLGAAGVERMRVTPTGTIVKGSGSTSATTSLLVQNSSGAASLQVTDDGSVFNLGKGGLASNTAFGKSALGSNTTGVLNVAYGQFALSSNLSANANTAVGNGSLSSNTVGENNTAIGYGTQSGNFTGSTILGFQATATGNNQFVVGSAAVNAGAVNSTSDVPATFLWSVRINGTNYKILMTT